MPFFHVYLALQRLLFSILFYCSNLALQNAICVDTACLLSCFGTRAIYTINLQIQIHRLAQILNNQSKLAISYTRDQKGLTFQLSSFQNPGILFHSLSSSGACANFLHAKLTCGQPTPGYWSIALGHFRIPV